MESKFYKGNQVRLIEVNTQDIEYGRYIGEVGTFNHYFENTPDLAIVDFPKTPNYCVFVTDIEIV